MSLFKNVTFHITVASLNDLPTDSVCEIAFAGRSNAGKSSAINTLANHSRLAFVSKMPGRTQHLNYFRLEDGKYLVDLPGYGFAKAPAEIRGQWEGLLAPYLIHRSALAGLVLIMDSRHPLTDLDRQMIDWFAQTGKPIHVLLSKADKLTRAEQAQVLRGVRDELVALSGRCSVQLFSSLKHTGVAEADKVLGAWLGLDVTESEAAPPTVNGPPGKVARPRQRKVQGWAARSAGKEKAEKAAEKAAAKNKKPPVA